MGSAWYESWFDSPYYELLYQHRDGAEAANFLKALMPHLKLTPQASVWDMACGQGRHAILLKHLGLNVLASDLSKKSIEKARGMFPELDFEVRDMRNCPKQKFEAVFNLFTSIGYFENSQDNQNVFNAAAEALHAHGLFILDFITLLLRMVFFILNKTPLRMYTSAFSVTAAETVWALKKSKIKSPCACRASAAALKTI